MTGATNPEGLAFDATGNLYVSEWGLDQISEFTTTGTVSILTGGEGTGFGGDGSPAKFGVLNGPKGIALDAAGNIWFSDSGNNRIRQIGVDGIIRTVIGSGAPGYTPPGSDPTLLSVYAPDGLFIDSGGTAYWAEELNHRIRKYNPASHILADVAGSTPPLTSSGPPTSLLLFNPDAAVTDPAGNLYISDSSNNVIRKILPSGVSSIVAGTGQAGFNGDNGTATNLQLNNPQGIAIDQKGNLLIADAGNGRVRQVNASGIMTTLMGAGNLLPLTGTYASADALIYPTGVAANPAGGFYAVDELFQILVAVDANSQVTLIQAELFGYLSFPTSVAVGPDGGAYVVDTFNNRIFKYFKGGLNIVAGTGTAGLSGDGGPATKARLLLPYGVAVDSSNNLYIADSGNYRIRMLDSTGTISTIAGTGQAGFSGDKGLAANAQIAFPAAMNVDASGNVEFADLLNQRIRVLQYQKVIADLTMSVDAATTQVNVGNTVTVRFSLASVTGLSAPVSITVSGAPAGISFQFSPSTITLGAGQTVLASATAQIPAGTALGTSTLTFTATSGSGANAIARTVTVSMIITNLPVITAAGVVSAASFAGGGVSPGELITVFGQGLGPASLISATFDSNNLLPQLLAGTRVLFDGNAAPILYAAAGQLAAFVPYAVGGKSTTQMQVEFNGEQSTAVTLSVVEAAPALFNAGTGTQAAALNQDFSVNSTSNPAKAGTEIQLFGTGEGATAPPSVDGKLATDVFPVPLLKITVTIGGEPAVVEYAAAAPYEVAGVFQINATIPTDLPTGPATVVVTVGTYVSTGTSTIAVQ